MFFFLLTLLPFFCRQNPSDSYNFVSNELFDPTLMRLNSKVKIEDYVDSLYKLQALRSFDTSVYVKLVSRTIKERFRFGLSNYNISENWIAFLSGRLLWSHFSAIVDPNDILKHPEGLCSQQTIVFMEILKQKGINVRGVGLGSKEGPGHFLNEVRYNNDWHLYDVTLEPTWTKISIHHAPMTYYLSHKDSLYLIYENLISKDLFEQLTNKVAYGEVNNFPAKNMLLFHQATLLLTYIFPLLFLCIFILVLLKKYRIKRTTILKQNH